MKTIRTIAAAGLLLGATSAMAQPKSSSGNFVFEVPDAFDITCDDSQGTVDDTGDMIVTSVGDLEKAKALIVCTIEARRANWTLTLTALNGGFMPKDNTTPAEYLQVDGAARALGMWVELGNTSNDAIISTVVPGTTDEPAVLNPVGEGAALTGFYMNPAAVPGIPVPVPLHPLFDPSAFSFRAHNEDGGGMSTSFALNIRAAFVASNVSDITSDEGTYLETITVTIASPQSI